VVNLQALPSEEADPALALPCPVSIAMGTLYCQKALSYGWDVKPRSWLSVVIKIPGCPSSRDVTPASWPNLLRGLCPSWPPNHPHTLIGSITVFSPVKQVSWKSYTVYAALPFATKPILAVSS